MKKRISVVMTVYGRETYLEEAIRSVLNQTFSDFEFIIVIENGANPSTVDTVNKFARADDRIRLIFNTERLRLAASLNRGIQEATGDFVARMDDDDYSLPERFAKQVSYLDAHVDIGLCGTLQITVTPDKESVLYCATDPESLKAEMLFGCQLSHSSIMFRRELFTKNEWSYPENRLAEDYSLWLDILDSVGMANLDEALIKHRYGFGNISAKKGERLQAETTELIKNALAKYVRADVNAFDDFFYSAWRRPRPQLTDWQRKQYYKATSAFLTHLEQANAKNCFVSEDTWRKVLWKRYRNILYQLSLREAAVLADGVSFESQLSIEKVIREFQEIAGAML